MNDGDDNGCVMDGWADHIADFKRWADMTEVIHDVVKDMHRDTTHLALLPTMVDKLHEMVTETRLLRESLVVPATDKKFLPLSATLPIIAAMTFCMCILGGILLIHMSDERALRVTPSSIEIGHK